MIERTYGIAKETTKETTNERNRLCRLLVRKAMKEGVGRISGCSSPSTPSSATSCLHSSSLSLRPRSSYFDASLCASSSAGGWAGPTSVVERKSGTAWLHLPSARSPEP